MKDVDATNEGTVDKEEAVSSSDESEDTDKITIKIAAPKPIAPVDELEYQLSAEQREKDKIAAGHYCTDPNDGTCYEWDEEQRAWFPRVTEDFIAAYQMSYGSVNPAQSPNAADPPNAAEPPNVGEPPNTSELAEQNERSGSENEPPPTAIGEVKKVETSEVKFGAKKQKKEPEWFDVDQDKNTWVYVTGLPLSTTDEEFLALMGKYGLVMEDQDSGRKKYKMYMDCEGAFKGDAKCCYLRKESIPLARQMLNGTRLPGSTSKIKIEKAKFKLKGEFNPKLKPKKKTTTKKKKKNKQDNLLDWRDRAGGNDLRPKHAKIVIMKHCFDPKEFLEDATMITEIRDDIKLECEKHGPVKKVLIFDRHPIGVVSVKFGTHEAADEAVKSFDKRWFGGSQLEAFLWDGVTDYAIEETALEREARLASWHKFIGEDTTSTVKTDKPMSSEPAEQSSEPAEISSEPAKQSSEPVEQSSGPAEQSSEPAGKTPEPAEKSSEAAEQSSEPVEQFPDITSNNVEMT